MFRYLLLFIVQVNNVISVIHFDHSDFPMHGHTAQLAKMSQIK